MNTVDHATPCHATVCWYRAVHQTTTVWRLLDPRAALLHGAPTAQDSWFPGYAWSIASCARCLNHLGWRFTRVGVGVGAEAVDRRRQREQRLVVPQVRIL